MPDQARRRKPPASNSRAGMPRKRPGVESPSKPAVIARRERDSKCIELRRGGMTFDAIARTLGYSDAGHAYNAFINFMINYPREDVDTLRELELDRLDAAQASIWARCMDSSDKDQTWALDRFLKISDQRARLMGLNKPVRQEVSVLTDATVESAIQTLQAQNEALALAHGLELPAVTAAAEVVSVHRDTR